MIYFTSDLHFYHDNIIKHSNRPFKNSDKMNATLIENLSKKIKATDKIFILGDISLKGAGYVTEILSQLKGRKYLIKGNHDSFIKQKDFDKNIFEWVKDYYELRYQNNLFVLSHYPFEEWNGFYRGSYHLHGHQHNKSVYNYKNLKNKIKRFDVGVDANNMEPVSIDDIIAFFEML